MLKNKILVIIALGTIALSSSCTKNNNTTVQEPLSYTGDIGGHVSLYDQYGSRVLTKLDSVFIQVVGVSTSVYPDSTGYYLFLNVPTGVYNFTASDNGYASTQTNNFQYLGDTLNKDIKLSAIPNFSPTSVTVYTAISTPGDSVVIGFNADTRARECILFVNKTSPVTNLPANYQLVYTKAIAANKTTAFILIPAQDLYDAGLSSGGSIYCAAYGYVVGDVSVYEDQTTGKNVYNAVSTTPQVITAIVP